MICRKKKKSFSLIELLIASSISFVVMLNIATVFRTGLFGYQNVEAALVAQRLVQQTLERIRCDLRNSFAYSRERVEFYGEADRVSFFGLIDCLQDNACGRQSAFITYYRDGKRLMRLCRSDREARRENSYVQSQEMTDQLDIFSLQYGKFDATSGDVVFFESWDNLGQLPAAVKINLAVNGFSFESVVAIWRVKEHGIHLCKLIYLREEEFDLLKRLSLDFLKRARRFFKKQSNSSSNAKKYPLECPTTNNLRQGNGKIYPCYEPTPMYHTRNSLFWGWRRVKEYFRDILDIDRTSSTKEAYALMNT